MINKLKKALSSVALQGINFTNDAADESNSSLRINPFSASWIPEHFSYTAYSIADTKEAIAANKLKVWGRFFKDTPSGSVLIRAINTTPRMPETLSEKIFERFPGKDALGEIEPTRVFFSKTGQSVYRGKHSEVPLNITDSKLGELGVGIYDIVWVWQYKTLTSDPKDTEVTWSNKWIPFEQSTHRVYVTVSCPKAPWTQTPFNDITLNGSSESPIWTEALHIACLWARGSRTIEEAGKKIADELFNCGKFVYHPDSHYSKETSLAIEKKIDATHVEEASVIMNYFYLTKVIERINGGNGLGDQVNCVDCSLIVSSLVNILGGNLHVGKLQRTEDTNYADPEIVTKNRFEINTIKAIGSESPEKTMASLESEGKSYFSFHSIAWQPADAESPQFDDPKNIIYDACVQFINDEADESAKAGTASGMPLGEDDDSSGYRAQLSASNELGIGGCLAQPKTVRAIRVV